MTTHDRIDMWGLINAYVETCGGDTSAATVSNRRQDAVALLERTIERIERAAVNRVLGEALNSGDGSYKP